jgi:hypothetical protein
LASGEIQLFPEDIAAGPRAAAPGFKNGSEFAELPSELETLGAFDAPPPPEQAASAKVADAANPKQAILIGEISSSR